MGTPRYPKDMGTEWNRLNNTVKQAFSSANRRPGISKIGNAVSIVEGLFKVLNSAGQTIVEMGKSADSRYGFRTYDQAGNTMVQAGELSDGAYGLALVNSAGELTKLHDFIFGPVAAFQTAADSTSSSTYVTFANGPSVDVVVGETGRLLVTIGCQMHYGLGATTSNLGGGRVSFSLSGANALAASDERSLVFTDQIVTSGEVIACSWDRRASYTHFVEGLSPGLTSVTMEYSAPYGNSCEFKDRTIVAMPF